MYGYKWIFYWWTHRNCCSWEWWKELFRPPLLKVVIVNLLRKTWKQILSLVRFLGGLIIIYYKLRLNYRKIWGWVGVERFPITSLYKCKKFSGRYHTWKLGKTSDSNMHFHISTWSTVLIFFPQIFLLYLFIFIAQV